MRAIQIPRLDGPAAAELVELDEPTDDSAVIVEVHGVPPGRYAIQAFHDANGNGECDQGLFGIPREGVGFSNNAFTGFSRPKFDKAAIDFTGGRLRLALKLRHMLG